MIFLDHICPKTMTEAVKLGRAEGELWLREVRAMVAATDLTHAGRQFASLVQFPGTAIQDPSRSGTPSEATRNRRYAGIGVEGSITSRPGAS